MSDITKLLLALPLAGVLLWFSGVVIQDLWGWFVVPLGVPALGLGQAVGINLLVSCVSSDAKVEEGKGFEALITYLFNKLFQWGIGALVAALIGTW